jgi:hypothetical protein
LRSITLSIRILFPDIFLPPFKLPCFLNGDQPARS